MSRASSGVIPFSPAPTGLPVPLEQLDHYTLIVPNAEASARFHVEVLGFRLRRIQRLNAGSAPEGQDDMLNYILELPSNPERVLVVTEGLTPESIFQRYLVRYGPGVHHVAYEVEDIDTVFANLRRAQIPTTSDRVVVDPLSGLRQVFLDREGPGYFIELIERTPAATGGNFVNDNMAGLARTMSRYLDTAPAVTPELLAPARVLGRSIRSEAEHTIGFLAHPGNLPRWTVHRTVRHIDGRWVELRQVGDIPLAVRADAAGRVVFHWSYQGQSREVVFTVRSENAGFCRVEVALPELPPARMAWTVAVIEAELEILSALLENEPERPGLAQLFEQVERYHLDVYQRRGL